jgi:hypothetical protein
MEGEEEGGNKGQGGEGSGALILHLARRLGTWYYKHVAEDEDGTGRDETRRDEVMRPRALYIFEIDGVCISMTHFLKS